MTSAAPNSLPEAPTAPQGHLLRLLDQGAELQAHVERLLDESARSGDAVDLLARTLTDPAATRAIEARLAELVAQGEESHERLTALSDAITRLSRTQFKANALAEAQEQKVAAALATLRELATRREQVADERARRDVEALDSARAAGRAEFAAELLPALDGLDAALESGRTLLARREPPPPAPDFWDRLRLFFGGEPPTPPSAPAAHDALAAWLEGLALARDRFERLLAAERIERIPALGQPFDPRLHVAVEARQSDDAPPGTIIALLRDGYRQGDRVLRYAEVSVATRAATPQEGL